MKVKKSKQKILREVKDYDSVETSSIIDKKKSLKFEDLGLTLPETPPTQVISIRMPSKLVNELRSLSSEQDIPYQSLIKLMLAQSVAKFRRKLA